jgi:homoserine O-acetyltransferase
MEATVPAPVREGVLSLPGPFALHLGGSLPEVQIGWRITGASGPWVVAMGGISAHRRVYVAEDTRAGWWPEVVGPGLALDTETLRILSFDYLGGSGATTGPSGPESFPSISTYDQARLLLALLDHLGIARVQTMVGASYGAMVALAFAEHHASRVGELIVISGSEKTHPMATAWRAVQRRVIRLGVDAGRAQEGVVLARALAMATYRSAREFGVRFSSHASATPEGFVFPVEDYLLARGRDYAMRNQPYAFLTLSESIDLHEVDITRISLPVLAIGVREDQLVPIEDMRRLAAMLPAARLHEISSLYGHDAFLKEGEQLREIFDRHRSDSNTETPS